MFYIFLGKKMIEELMSIVFIFDLVLVNWCYNCGIDSIVFVKC